MFVDLAMVGALGFATPTAPAPGTAGLCDIAVRSPQLDYETFEAAAHLRVPGVRLREADGTRDEVCADRLHGYVELRADEAERWELSLVTSDGRAWYRTVEAGPDTAHRALASALANLLVAIEETDVEADARDVELPAELGEPSESPEPVPSSTSIDPPEPVPREPTLELGVRGAGLALIGLAPGPGFRTAGGELGVTVRLPDGLAFGLDLRAASRTRSGVSLTRMRVALGVGVVSRTGKFEIPLLFSGVVEPWFARESGATVPLGQPPLIGGGVRVAPGLRLDAGRVQLRLGLALGLEIAVEAAPGALAAAIARDAVSDPIVRAGGVELSAGVELGIWVPVYGRR